LSLWKWIVPAYIAVGGIQSCVLFLKKMKEKQTKKHSQKKKDKRQKKPTVYRFVTAKI
jgi:hypothetical protein